MELDLNGYNNRKCYRMTLPKDKEELQEIPMYGEFPRKRGEKRESAESR